MTNDDAPKLLRKPASATHALYLWQTILACMAKKQTVTFDWSVVPDRGYAKIERGGIDKTVIIRRDDPASTAYSIRHASAEVHRRYADQWEAEQDKRLDGDPNDE